MPAEVVADRYELVALVGTGGMSSVYRAHDRLLERTVALKLLHPQYAGDAEYVERFRREARAVAQLSHPSIVTVIDRGSDDGRQYIVFEFVEGESLKQLLERTGPLPARRAAELALAAAEALEFAHGHGLVHRDVKPQNLLVTPDGAVKVTDFGIARSLDVEHGLTQTGTMLGTSDYLSPEQAGGRPVSPATDVYSLGVVLYELLTGDVPFRGDNFVAVALKHLNEPAPDPAVLRPDLPPRLGAIVARALEKDPGRRFASMELLARELRRYLAGLDEPEAAATVVLPGLARRRTARTRRRGRRTVYALASAAVAGALAGAVLAVLQGSKGMPATADARAGTPVSLRGVGNLDPGGSDTHADTAPDATDGNPSTYWYTQIYATPDFGGLKAGLGLVLDAGRPVRLSRIVVTSATPGFRAQFLAGDSLRSQPAGDSRVQTADGRTTFVLRGATARYYVLWITRLPPGGTARVNEVTAER